VSGRAVILGGGGVAGIAWEIGVLHGLSESGVEPGTADAVIGTSAGSFAGTCLTAGLVKESYEAAGQSAGEEIPASMSEETLRGFEKALSHRQRDQARAARELATLSAETVTVSTAQRLAVVRARLPVQDWPSAKLKITAIDADTGALHLLDTTSGLSLVEAAAASGAVPGVWPVVEAGNRRWIDGGSFSATNADLARPYASALVIAPAPIGLHGQRTLAEEVASLRAGSTTVTVMTPDEASQAAIGSNPFDPERRAPAARAGYDQGARQATEITRHWP
jgi:NTE family protein